MFYRPSGLNDNASEAPHKLQWRLQQKAGKPVLHVTNPTGYFVSFNKVETNVNGRKYTASSSMVAPKTEADFAIPGLSGMPGKASVNYMAINDFGGAINGKADL